MEVIDDVSKHHFSEVVKVEARLNGAKEGGKWKELRQKVSQLFQEI